MDKTTLCVLDWQIRNILRLKKELKNANHQKTKKIHYRINQLCQNINHLDPDKTKRLELLFLYFREHLRTADAKKRLSLLAHSLSDFLFSCGPQTYTDNHLLRQLLARKNIGQILQNATKRNQNCKSKIVFPIKKGQLCHD